MCVCVYIYICIYIYIYMYIYIYIYIYHGFGSDNASSGRCDLCYGLTAHTLGILDSSTKVS